MRQLEFFFAPACRKCPHKDDPGHVQYCRDVQFCEKCPDMPFYLKPPKEALPAT